jgi:putative spermidine/putrescine transport system permease protein
MIWTLVGGPLLLGAAFMAAYSIGLTGLLAHGLSFTAWTAVLGDRVTWVTLGFSVWVGAASLGVSILGALLVLALRPARAAPDQESSVTPWFLPIAVPPMVAGLTAVLWLGNAGELARWAYALGWIRRPAQFPSPIYSSAGLGIIVTQAALVWPFLVVLFDRLARAHRVRDLAEAARTLGASPFAAWRRVGAPLLLRAATPTLGIYFLALSGAFEIPLLVGASYPTMLSVRVAQLFGQFDLSTRPQAYALALLYAFVASTGSAIVLRVRTRAARSERA